MRPPLPASAWPIADPAVEAALQNAFRDGSWGRYDGPHGRDLIRELAERHQLAFAYPCSSGTVAVELALRGLRIEPGDEVLLAGYDFPGNFRAIEAVGAVPVLVDIQPRRWTLDPGCLAEAMGPRVRAVLVSHLHGGLADMRAIRAFCDERQIGLVEDACQAPLGTVQGRTTGTWGDVGVLSFGGSKLLTAGRGGAVVTNREDIWQRIKVYADRGNLAFPLSELQAAVLLPQLQTLAARHARRQRAVRRLLEALASIGQLTPVELSADDEPCFYKVGWLCHDHDNSVPRAQLVAAWQAAGVPIDVGFRGFVKRHTRCRAVGELTHSRTAAERTVVLHHPVLLEDDDRLAALADHIAAGVAGP